MSKTIIVNHLSDLDSAAKELLAHCNPEKIFAFHGEMGVGKTTLIKSLCHQLGVSTPITSPSFSLINEYQNRDGEKIYHFDFYRIRNPSEAFDLGYEDYFYGPSYCFIEWPEKIQKLIPKSCVNIAMTEENGKRIIRISNA